MLTKLIQKLNSWIFKRTANFNITCFVKNDIVIVEIIYINVDLNNAEDIAQTLLSLITNCYQPDMQTFILAAINLKKDYRPEYKLIYNYIFNKMHTDIPDDNNGRMPVMRPLKGKLC